MKKIIFYMILVLAVVCPKTILAQNLENEEIHVSAKGYIDVLVYLKEDIKIKADSVKLSAKKMGQDENTAYVQGLKTEANLSQKNLVDFLDEKEKNGDVKSYESFYITNAVHVICKAELLDDLENFEEVKGLTNNGSVELSKTVTYPAHTSGADKNWSYKMLDLEKARENFGLDGEGVVIGFIDSGADWKHVNISENFRGLDANGEINTRHSWFDLVGNSTYPIDYTGHGTAVISIATGNKKLGGEIEGGAPKAKWISAAVFDNDLASNANVIKAAQWMLAPGGDASKAPQIINNSWGSEGINDPWFRDVVKAWNSVGIISFFAAGNDMEKTAGLSTIENPAGYPEAFAIGSINDDYILSSFSKKGPTPYSSSLIKPELVGPGNMIYSATVGGGYNYMVGTSMATPHYSAMAALAIQQRGKVQVKEMREALIDAAEPLTDSDFPSSPNMGYGYGVTKATKLIENLNLLDGIERIAGSDRYKTAIAISKKYFSDGASAVYITGARSYSDALVMSLLTKTEDGPLLLSDSNQVSSDLIEEIRRLGAKKIYVIGGEKTISPSVFKKLESLAKVERISGEDRKETSLSIAKKVEENTDIKELFLVNGYMDADAISAAGPAKKIGVQVILTDGKNLEKNTRAYILASGIQKIVIVGGEVTMNPSIEKEIEKMGVQVSRISGKDRYQTSLLLNKRYFSEYTDFFIASGVEPVDALAAGPLSGNGIPMVLVEKVLPEGVKEYLSPIKKENMKVLGGENSVNRRVLKALIK